MRRDHGRVQTESSEALLGMNDSFGQLVGKILRFIRFFGEAGGHYSYGEQTQETKRDTIIHGATSLVALGEFLLSASTGGSA